MRPLVDRNVIMRRITVFTPGKLAVAGSTQ